MKSVILRTQLKQGCTLLSSSSSKSKCYDDKPTKTFTNVSFQHYGVVYNGDRQCELAFGKGFKRCLSLAVCPNYPYDFLATS